METYAEMRTAVRPEFAGQPVEPSVFGLALADGVTADQLAPPAGVVVASTEETYLSIPGTREQKSSLNAIIYASLAVAGLVVALFFALVVLEKRELFAALKALGASTQQARQRGGPPGDRGHGHRGHRRGDRRLARRRSCCPTTSRSCSVPRPWSTPLS